MHREILFRGKKISNGEWIFGYFFKTEVGCFIGPYNEEEQVIPESVGQYTGLKDMEGVRIFEGDILREPAKDEWDEENYASYEVFFHDGDIADNHIGWQMNRMHFHGSVCGGSLLMNFLPKWTKRLEIIGNIHDSTPADKTAKI